MQMEINLDDVDLAIVVKVEILREVLRKMSVNGRRWWIACEPEYALEKGYITIGYGDPNCLDRLNTVLYRIPTLNTDRPLGGPDQLVVLLDSSVVTPEQPGLYRDGDNVVEDEIADIEDFFIPIRRALVPVLAQYSGFDLSMFGDAVRPTEGR
jgi:hypothetical protein